MASAWGSSWGRAWGNSWGLLGSNGLQIINGPGNLRKRHEKGTYWHKLLSPPTIRKLEELAPEVAEAIELRAVAQVAQATKEQQSNQAVESIGIAYQQAYFEIYTELVAEMRQARENEQIAMIVAALI